MSEKQGYIGTRVAAGPMPKSPGEAAKALSVVVEGLVQEARQALGCEPRVLSISHSILPTSVGWAITMVIVAEPAKPQGKLTLIHESG